METVTERFLRYVKIDTQSLEDKETVPSTEKQFDLARLLEKELKEIGAKDVRVSQNCYVYATIPATIPDHNGPVFGFIAHMDTSDAVSGKGVKPRIVENYDGNFITLNDDLGVIMDPAEYPDLKNRIGEDLIVTDGTTLLGADDKAGVAEIMTMAEFLLTHPEIPHGTVKIGFTPDEEVGRGVDFFDVDGFGADYAYTVDGGVVGEIEYENFNAASLKLVVKGKSVHPGSAKNIMKNALTLAMQFNSLLPAEQVPEHTEGYEGFFHLTDMSGNVEEARLHYILRDHDENKLEEKKAIVLNTVKYLNGIHGEGTFSAEITDSYSNMKKMIEPHMFLIENAERAMKALGIVPKIVAIRGGTDGARLSYMGIPCPNLCTGGANFHGRFEYTSVQALEKCTEMLIELVKICGTVKD